MIAFTLAASGILGAVVPGVSRAATVNGDQIITATQLPGPYADVPSFNVDITNAEGLLYRFIFTLEAASPPSVPDIERWIKDHDPRTPGSGQTCVNIWNNYCVPRAGDLG